MMLIKKSRIFSCIRSSVRSVQFSSVASRRIEIDDYLSVLVCTVVGSVREFRAFVRASALSKRVPENAGRTVLE
jgi:hypothetical protein